MREASCLKISASLRLCVYIFIVFSVSHAQRLAVVAPEKSELASRIANSIAENLSGKLRVVDSSMAETAFRALEIGTPFNMTVGDARRTADAIGCDFILVVNAASMRRTSLSRGSYFEAFAAMYLVSERSGRLVYWDLVSAEADEQAKAESGLLLSLKQRFISIADKLDVAQTSAMAEKPPSAVEQLPPDSSQQDKSFRPPVPYRRIKPEYTQTARDYGVSAVVEIEADIEADGRVSRAEVVRWAGFGLDGSAVEAVRKMNWRPAERNGKPLAMRVLLRYNFTRIEKD